jgi:glycosyltransferase involved in cell wall biosynthesis
MQIAIYHNILWSKYKGGVFSQVYVQSMARGIGTSFVQIAETDDERVALGDVDLSYHTYPFRLLFRGAYGHSSRWRRVVTLVQDVFKHPSDLVVMPGYHRVEYWAMLFSCIMLRRKRAVFCDSTEFDRPKSNWRELAKRVFFSGCDGFFCYGIRSKEYLMKYGAKESKIIYRYQAAALPHDYDPADVLARYEALPPAAPNIQRFTYVGRLSVEKGINDLLEAFALVYADNTGARLDLVGAGPLREELVTRVRELQLETAVTFLGAKGIGEIAELFMNSTASVLPSHSEPWGLVVNESLSYGCPVVVSNVCGCVPDLVIDGVTGYSFEAGNVEDLLGALRSVIKMTADRVAVAKDCLKVISGFTPDRAAAQILDGCERIVGDIQ